jgi:hypothetical protein
MKKIVLTLTACLVSIGAAQATSSGCSISQVMKTLHQNKAYSKYEYASNWDGDQGAPTHKLRKSSDQYLFWVDKDGTTFPAVVTYPQGSCTGGKAVVKTDQGE